jgi:hypothetical protein
MVGAQPASPYFIRTMRAGVLDNPDSVGHSCLVSWRGSVKSKKTKEKDPCLVALGRIWPTILLAYDDVKDLKPVVDYLFPVEKPEVARSESTVS